jgi:putative endonuclease
MAVWAKTWLTATCAARGCTVVARNYAARSGAGEIDLVAWEGVLVFVEVKTRSSADFGAPDAAVDGEKQRRIAIAAREYGYRAQVEAAARASILSASCWEASAHRPGGATRFASVTYNQVFAVGPTRKDVPDCLSCAKTRSPAAG